MKEAQSASLPAHHGGHRDKQAEALSLIRALPRCTLILDSSPQNGESKSSAVPKLTGSVVLYCNSRDRLQPLWNQRPREQSFRRACSWDCVSFHGSPTRAKGRWWLEKVRGCACPSTNGLRAPRFSLCRTIDRNHVEKICGRPRGDTL